MNILELKKLIEKLPEESEIVLYHEVYCGGGDEETIEYDVKLGTDEELNLIIFPNDNYRNRGKLEFYNFENLEDA